MTILRFHFFFASRPENIFKLSPWVINEKFWKFFESVDFKFQFGNSSEDCALILNQYIPRYVLFEALISRNLRVDRENFFPVKHFSVTKKYYRLRFCLSANFEKNAKIYVIFYFISFYWIFAIMENYLPIWCVFVQSIIAAVCSLDTLSKGLNLWSKILNNLKKGRFATGRLCSLICKEVISLILCEKFGFC